MLSPDLTRATRAAIVQPHICSGDPVDATGSSRPDPCRSRSGAPRCVPRQSGGQSPLQGDRLRAEKAALRNDHKGPRPGKAAASHGRRPCTVRRFADLSDTRPSQPEVVRSSLPRREEAARFPSVVSGFRPGVRVRGKPSRMKPPRRRERRHRSRDGRRPGAGAAIGLGSLSDRPGAPKRIRRPG
jgi:hypothetical protein